MSAESSAPRGFPAVLGDYDLAVTSINYGATPSAATRSAQRLPLSEWSEARRDLLSNAAVAANWRANVSDCAHELRERLHAQENGGTNGSVGRVKEAARALLRALGES